MKNSDRYKFRIFLKTKLISVSIFEFYTERYIVVYTGRIYVGGLYQSKRRISIYICKIPIILAWSLYRSDICWVLIMTNI